MRSAFTLIELVVAVSILIIAASLSKPLYQRYVLQAMMATGKAQVVALARKAVVSYAAKGTCFPSDTGSAFDVDPKDSGVLGSYKLLDVSPGYEGCIALGVFKTVDNGGNGKLAGKSVKIIYVRDVGSSSTTPYIIQCFTDALGVDLGLQNGDQGCLYDQKM